MIRRMFVAGAVLFLSSAAALTAQEGVIDLGDPAWVLEGEDSRVEVFDGRTTITLVNGIATLPGASFRDGTIEFDVMASGERSFAFLRFREQDDGAAEEVYVRPHKTTLPDAIQYSPIYGGASQWQLFHGPGGTAAAALPRNTWIPVRLVVEGRRAALFVGDVDEPQLIVSELHRPARTGYFSFRNFFPTGSDASVPTRFSNLRVTPGRPDFDLEAAARAQPRSAAYGSAGGLPISRWDISAVFDTGTDDVRELPAAARVDSEWRPVSTDSQGRLVLGSVVETPGGLTRRGIGARFVVETDRAMDKRLDVGFSDFVSVFVNGRLVYSGNHSYSFDEPARLGLMSLHQAALYLPLAEGHNEVVFVVSEIFGGWGLMARFEDPEGIRLVD